MTAVLINARWLLWSRVPMIMITMRRRVGTCMCMHVVRSIDHVPLMHTHTHTCPHTCRNSGWSGSRTRMASYMAATSPESSWLDPCVRVGGVRRGEPGQPWRVTTPFMRVCFWNTIDRGWPHVQTSSHHPPYMCVATCMPAHLVSHDIEIKHVKVAQMHRRSSLAKEGSKRRCRLCVSMCTYVTMCGCVDVHEHSDSHEH
jgi:hypothetical protein